MPTCNANRARMHGERVRADSVDLRIVTDCDSRGSAARHCPLHSSFFVQIVERTPTRSRRRLEPLPPRGVATRTGIGARLVDRILRDMFDTCLRDTVKLRRAYGGCLGSQRRRRTWTAAISSGEPLTGFDPEISEWGNPLG